MELSHSHDLGASYTVHPTCEKSLSYTPEFVSFSEFCYTSKQNVYNTHKKINGPKFYILPQKKFISENFICQTIYTFT